MENTFDCKQEYILENERVLLRPLKKEDYTFLLPFALNEPDLWHFSLVSAAGEKGLEHYIQLALDGRNTEKEYAFIVYDKVKQAYAGSTRFYDINVPFQTLQLGYTWYGSHFQGTGLNKQCKFLLLSFAFEQLGMERVEFRADNENARSIAAMKSIGCKVDGLLRANMPKRQGGRRDSIVLSILKEEWFKRVKSLLADKLR